MVDSTRHEPTGLGPQARPVRRVTLSGQVADQLRSLALSGAVPVGGALPSEAELSRMFQCSRGAVREALRSLEQMGIVRRAPNGRELLVASVAPEKISDSFQLYVHLSEVTFGEFFEFLEGMERWIAGRAAARQERQALTRLGALLAQPIGDMQSLVAVEEEFHDLLAAATGNRLIVVARKPIRALLHDALAAMIPLMAESAIGATLRAHAEILAAVRAGDEGAAGDWAYRHSHAFRRALALLNTAESEPMRPLSAEAERGGASAPLDLAPPQPKPIEADPSAEGRRPGGGGRLTRNDRAKRRFAAS